MGIAFGPILMVWFLAIGYLGLVQIIDTPEILKALNPIYGFMYLKECSLRTLFVVFGGVVLAI
jgi:KUP system potassium uptake protein